MTLNRNLFSVDFLSAAGLSRRLDVPEKRILRALKDGVIAPDAKTGAHTYLFNAARLESIRRVLAGNKTEVLA